VGVDWNLSAGGVITRSVNDEPDELTNPNITDIPTNQQKRKLGIYYSFRRQALYKDANQNPVDWSSQTFMESTAYWAGGTGSSDVADTEPDEFSFNLPGCSGKFYMGPDGWRVKCNKPVQVRETGLLPTPATMFPDPATITPDKYPETFGGFIITTEDGTEYVFGNTTDAIEYSVPFFAQANSNLTANAWYLTKVRHNNREINLTYQREAYAGRYISQLFFSATSGTEQAYIKVGSTIFAQAWTECGTTTNARYDKAIEGQLVAPVYLTSIAGDNVTVKFKHSVSPELRYDPVFYIRNAYNPGSDNVMPGGQRAFPLLYRARQPGQTYASSESLDVLQWQQLDDIEIQYQQRTIRSFHLGYNDVPGERLILQSVQERGAGVTKPAYRFTYYSTPNGATPYQFDKTDAWGFYNNLSSINYLNINNSATYTQLRAPGSRDDSRYGALWKLYYPTGGYSEFEYEQHSYSKQVQQRSASPVSFSTNQPAGGLRIKIVRAVTDGVTVDEREYLYVKGYYPGMASGAQRSSGILNGQFQYGFSDYRIPLWGNSGSDGYVLFSRFSTQSVLPACSNNHGTHVGYSEVVEKRRDGSFTKYVYTNFDTRDGGNYHYDEAPVNYLRPDPSYTAPIPYQPYSSTAEERGLLLSKTLYTPANIPVSLQEYAYTPFDKATDFVRALKARYYKACQDDMEKALEATAYKLNTYSALPVRETTTLYDLAGGAPLVTVKAYTYKQYNGRTVGLVATETTADGKGQSVATTYKYAGDFANPNTSLTDPVARAIAAMPSRNMVGLPIETRVERGGRVVSATLNTFFFNPANLTHIVPYQTFATELSKPLDLPQYLSNSPGYSTGGSNATFSPGQLRLQHTVSAYDAAGNALSMQKADGPPTSFLWGYNSTLPIAQATNAAPNEIYHSNFEEDKMVATATADAARTWYSPGSYLKFEATPSDPNRPSTREVAHTGQLAGAMYTGYNGEQAHAFSTTLTIPTSSSSRRYILSGWVYTNGPAASIWLFPNLPGARTSTGTINYYDGLGNSSRPDLVPSYATTQETGRWVYLQKEVEVPGDATLLTIRLTNFWNGAGHAAALANGGGVWFDDVRLHPAGAQMVTSTHSPLDGPTSISDANNQPTYYEYDGLQRLQLVKDTQGNVVKHVEYHYKQQ
jgi:YD repeat-containing protein